MIRCFVLLLLLLGSALASVSVVADVFDMPLRARYAKELFDTRRYRDAEIEFDKLRVAHHPLHARNLDSYLNVLDHLARSISQQGRSDRVLPLLQERHVLVAQSYDSRGFVFANSMSRLAEAMYREGNRSSALSFIDYAIELYQDLRPRPDDAISLARSNRLQYKVAPFSTAMLPMDLSDFYTRCELLQSQPPASDGGQAMSGYVEVGKDYIPEGQWADHFDMLEQQHASTHDNSRHYRIFLPHSSEPMRGDLCFVADSQRQAGEPADGTEARPLISAESAAD